MGFETFFMEEALKEATTNANEVPIGAVIVDYTTNQIIARGSNLCIKEHDPTMHAEIVAIRRACAFLQNYRLPNCDLYVTLEPCPMCAQAISFARIRHIYFGATDIKGGGIVNGPQIFNFALHKPVIYDNILATEGRTLLVNFFKERRKCLKKSQKLNLITNQKL